MAAAFMVGGKWGEEGQCVAEKETEIVLYEQAPLSFNFIRLNWNWRKNPVSFKINFVLLTI